MRGGLRLEWILSEFLLPLLGRCRIEPPVSVYRNPIHSEYNESTRMFEHFTLYAGKQYIRPFAFLEQRKMFLMLSGALETLPQ